MHTEYMLTLSYLSGSFSWIYRSDIDEGINEGDMTTNLSVVGHRVVRIYASTIIDVLPDIVEQLM